VCPMASHERNVTSVRLRRRAGCVCASAVGGRVELRCEGTAEGERRAREARASGKL